MHIIIYGTLDDNDDNLSIDGPFFYMSERDFARAEILARELANSKSKNQCIPWVFELRENETVAQAMVRFRNGWFKKFKARTMETHKTIQKDQSSSTCPFSDVDVEKLLTQYLQ